MDFDKDFNECGSFENEYTAEDVKEDKSMEQPDVYGDVNIGIPNTDLVITKPQKPKKKNGIGLKVAAVIVCCAVLMLGSGAAGAKIAENRFNAMLLNNGTEEFSEAAMDNSGSAQDNIHTEDPAKSESVFNFFNSMGNVNPDGVTLSLTQLFSGANPAVVAISTETTGRNVFGRIVTLPAAGSGFIISDNGYIVTNNHVIDNAENISVLLYDGTKYPAILVGNDRISDLAVLKIDAKELSYLSWGDSNALQVGEQVAALGNPLGEFANSMTVGYISALDREIDIDGTPRHMLQTDAAVNNGNSGGPLLNLKGQVVGVVSAKSGGTNVEGLGFAIPSSKVQSVTEQLITDGYVKGRPVMGVQIGTQQNYYGQLYVYIGAVNSGSAAEKAGVKEGDVIISANGTDIMTVDGLKGIINDLSPGDTLMLKVQRESGQYTLNVILDEYKPSDTEPSQVQIPQGNTFPNFPIR